MSRYVPISYQAFSATMAGMGFIRMQRAGHSGWNFPITLRCCISNFAFLSMSNVSRSTR